VELTEAGDALFFRLKDAEAAFDQQLRHGFRPPNIAKTGQLLDRLRDNMT
jgi:DNA-binding MarR family transcriptional regulator